MAAQAEAGRNNEYKPGTVTPPGKRGLDRDVWRDLDDGSRGALLGGGLGVHSGFLWGRRANQPRVSIHNGRRDIGWCNVIGLAC